MVAQHAIDRSLEAASHPPDAVQRRLERPECLAAIVAGQDADVVTQLADELTHPLHRGPTDVHVQVTEVQDGEAIETRRQILEDDVVAPDDDAFGVAARAPVETAQLQRASE